MVIDVQGPDLPLNMPITTFEPTELPQLSPQLLDNLRLAEQDTPTLLQKHVVPIALAGRDLIVVGATPESQAAALLLPVASKLANEPPATARGGLRALVLVPTREAATQTVREVRRLVRKTPLRCTLACGGVTLEETQAELATGVELLVATPGRLVDLVERDRLSLGDVKLLALLGLDSLLDSGFEPQLRRLFLQVCVPSLPPPRRATALFSLSLAPLDLTARLLCRVRLWRGRRASCTSGRRCCAARASRPRCASCSPSCTAPTSSRSPSALRSR